MFALNVQNVVLWHKCTPEDVYITRQLRHCLLIVNKTDVLITVGFSRVLI